MNLSEISRLMNGIGVTAPPWEHVARLLAAVGHDPADIHPHWAAAHRTAVFGPSPASGTAT